MARAVLAMPGQELFKGDTQDATLTEILGPLTPAAEKQTVLVTSRVRRHVSFIPHLT